MRVQVDEAGDHVQPAGIDDLAGAGGVNLAADGGDDTVLDADVAAESRCPLTVEDGSALDDGIEFRHGCSPGERDRRCAQSTRRHNWWPLGIRSLRHSPLRWQAHSPGNILLPQFPCPERAMTATAIPPIAWPVDREIPDLDWQPPAGTRVISADDHWLEPPDLFVDRMPAKYRDQAPKVWARRDRHAPRMRGPQPRFRRTESEPHAGTPRHGRHRAARSRHGRRGARRRPHLRPGLDGPLLARGRGA